MIYIKGENNGAADAMSRLPKEETNNIRVVKSLCNLPTTDDYIQECDVTTQYMSETYGVDKLELGTFPLTYKLLDKYQRKDKQLLKILKRTIDSTSSTDHTSSYHTKSFRGGGTEIDLICRSDKIVVPKALQNYVLEWYHNHTYLLHPGQDRTELTIKQHLYWENMQDDIRKHVSICDTCQRTKKYKKNTDTCRKKLQKQYHGKDCA